MPELISVQNLQTQFLSDGKLVRAVDNISFSLQEKETVAIVGESGSGKSVTSLSIMRLVPNPPGKIVGGQVNFHGEDLLALSEAKMRQIRGNKISMIFQEPMTSLNPVHRIGEQIAETIMLHQKLDRAAAWEKTVALLRTIGIPSPEKRALDYPHQLSGGMRQRVMIAMALSCHPDLLIADEPTTALDVTIQAQILDLMRKMREEFGMAIMLITHDLGVVAEMAHRVLVMYAGRIVEEAPVQEIFAEPLHPYTVGLLRSIPRLSGNKDRLYVIDGSVPDLSRLPSGCPFHPRCPDAGPRCRRERPELLTLGERRRAACWLRSGEGVE
ncbi:peptide/nickel transport system ATP-binding protein/oligopeptide transport system ATP-binding protein [Hydrogenispora ethanolica]|jgi:peptide/nickel transport system ATP-binding protein/oligopeptide transport system ATP-binding protein|uniref:Peptide/nickel transport system ATP-binding protein/oligopeptide transport system ATP-binding protein n=1 Tax=Hydrogenispora ethanolica TaxID=1082276 RepID=A0A4R1S1J7_HYDET|nr:ABC transporter ATP-binding protein [Hydrogenispora ethanolica]TCL72440.1 peptide/nickel transport system ATP-binding protein/oligopeptide transport system ATP-binding protein [Hydrogenispora ethanolica]